MRRRVITGICITIIYVAVLLLATYVHPICFDIFIFMLAMCGAYEMARALSNTFSKPILIIDLIGIVLGFAGFWFAQYYFKTYSAGMAAYFIVLIAMIIATVIVTSASKVFVKGNAVSTIFILLYPCALLMFSLGLNYFINSEISISVSNATPMRNAGIALMFVVPTLTDIFAFLVGSKLKGKKLCPSISPNKTVSGAIGGLLGGILGAGVVLLLTFLAHKYSVNIFGLQMLTETWTSTIINFIMLGLFGSVFDQIGDLVASYIKRRSGIKDFSNVLPGHGGVLDRVDGFIFCGVFYYLYFAVMVLI